MWIVSVSLSRWSSGLDGRPLLLPFLDRLAWNIFLFCLFVCFVLFIWLGWQASLVALFGQVGVEYIHCLLNQLHDLHGDLFNWLSNCSVPKRKKKLAANQKCWSKKFHHKGKPLVGCRVSYWVEEASWIHCPVYVSVLYCFLQQLNITETVPFFVNIHFSADVEEISEDWNRSGCCKGRLPSPQVEIVNWFGRISTLNCVILDNDFRNWFQNRKPDNSPSRHSFSRSTFKPNYFLLTRVSRKKYFSEI